MKKYAGYMIDLDGTIYRGKEKIPAAKRFIERLQEHDIPFLFVTNNSTQAPIKVVENLANNFDIHVKEENVYTSALATADYIADLNKDKRSVYVIGEVGLKKQILIMSSSALITMLPIINSSWQLLQSSAGQSLSVRMPIPICQMNAVLFPGQVR